MKGGEEKKTNNVPKDPYITDKGKEPQELRCLLESKGKGSYLCTLIGAGIISLEDFIAAEELPPGLPKMTARVLKKKAKDEIELRNLRDFLTRVDKVKFFDVLVAANIRSPEDIVAKDLPKEVPKMTARILKKKAQDEIEMRPLKAFLFHVNLEKFLDVLFAANIRSPEDIVAKDLPKEVPRITARILKKKAQDEIELRGLKAFLIHVDQEKCLDVLVAANIRSPEDIRDASFESLAQPGIPRMIARILKKRASEVCKHDDPNFEFSLTKDEKEQIEVIWHALADTGVSFGARFYKELLSMDQRAMECFSAVDLETLGQHFDRTLDEFVAELNKPQNFCARRDQLVGRFLRYQIPVQTLWFGSQAFTNAVTSISPRIYVSHDMSVWARFYRTIIPPLHSTLLKGINVESENKWKAKNNFIPMVCDSLARRGYFYFTVWLKENPDFDKKMWQVLHSLAMWQKGSGSWTAFKEKSVALLDGLESVQMKIMLLLEIPLSISDRYEQKTGSNLGDILLAAGCALFGIEEVSSHFRARQQELVWNQWNEVYRTMKDEFGKRFYENFLTDPLIKETFKNTEFKMQEERFVHQLNSLLIRINEDFEKVIRPMLLELGARHQVYYLVGSREMLAMVDPLGKTIKEMLGKCRWNAETYNAWGFVTNIVVHEMMTGWTYGFRALQGKIPLHNIAPNQMLRNFRDESPLEFSTFFDRFARSVSSKHSGSDAAERYRAAVNQILDESSETRSLNQIHSLGRRHRKYHGVTIEQLASAAKEWMSIAADVFGERFKYDIASEWALLWQTIAISMNHSYRHNRSCPDLGQMLDIAFPSVQRRRASMPTAKNPVLILKKKVLVSHDTAILHFVSTQPIKQKAGQFAKLRFNINGKSVSRFYSIASCPDVQSDMMTTKLEFLIKEVRDGKASPYLVHDIEETDACEFLTVAGNFVFPEPLDGTKRLMVSAGVGLVSFMSGIRSIASHIRAGLIKKKVSISLLHSERSLNFPFFAELLAISREFHNHDLLQFDFTFCYTGVKIEKNEDKVKALQETEPSMMLVTERVGIDILSSTRNKFDAPKEVPVYACGPSKFQKSIRETLLKEMGHNRKLINLEFFDL